jgi:phosphoserine phosphatase RsbU/P
MAVHENSDGFLGQKRRDRLLMLPGTAVPVAEALNDGIVVAAADNRILYANQAVQRLLGWRPEDLVGAPITVLVPERLRGAHLAGFARYFASGQARIVGQPARVPALSSDGSEHAVELVLSTLPLSDGGELAVATIRDAVVRVDFEQRSALAHHLLSIFTEEAAEAELVDHILGALGHSLEAAVAALWLPSPDGRQLHAAAVWHDAAQPRPTFERVTRELRLGRGECLPGRVWRSGAAAWIGELGADTNFRRRPAAIADNLHSAFAFPVRAHAMTLGVIELMFPQPREPDDTSLEVMAIIGSRLGEFLQHKHLEEEKERITEREREIATSLQQSLLPADLPAIPGLDLGVYFHPGGDLVIGGDFYDVFPIRDTKNAEPTAWGLLVGDVCGTGPEAAAITGLVRYTARALARMGLPPVEVLTQVNAALLDRGAPEDRFCTGIFAVVTQKGDGYVLRLTNGGHPAPLLRQHGSSAAPVEVTGQLLGVFETISLHEEVIELEADDTIMFYTDGVTEARAASEQFGEERLLAVLDEAHGASATEIAGRVVRTTREFADSLSDDIVVLVMRAKTPSQNRG